MAGVKKIVSYLAIAIIAVLAAFNYVLFVFPNKFAPAGLDGICTMIQDVLHINMGYLAFLVNIPLIIAAFVVLSREFALKSTVFIVVFSVSLVGLDLIDLSDFLYSTSTGTSIALAPVAAGTIRGLLYVVTLNLNGSAAGIDIISALIKYKKPHLDLMNIIFFINILVAVSSYFVYGMSVEPVICSILYSFISSTVCSQLRSSKTKTVKYEIITSDPEKLCDHITHKLNQKATIIDAHGAYTGKTTKMVICVVPKKTAPFVEEILLHYKDSVVFKSIVDDSVAGIAYK